MKLKVVGLTMFVAGVTGSSAFAAPPAGNGPAKNAAAASLSTTTVAGAPSPGKVTVCHPTGSKSHPYVKITVSKSAVKPGTRHGDVLPGADGTCPSAAPAAATTA